MSRKVMVVEPDANSRAMLDRVLTAAGYTTEEFDDVRDARILLDEDAFDLAVVNEVEADGALLDGVRFLRARYPRLPLVVTGAMLSPPVLIQLLRLGVRDALPKPYSPTELREAVARVAVFATRDHDLALDYAAAVSLARAELDAGRTETAARALSRARALSDLDAEVTSLDALRAELEGRDEDAARGYRAAMALQHEESAEGPSPREGLERLGRWP